MGRDSGIEELPAVMTQGRTHGGSDAGFRAETSWPPAGTESLSLRLGRSAAGGTLDNRGSGPSASYTADLPGTEELAQRALAAEGRWLTYQTAPLAADTPSLTPRSCAPRSR
jgi:hypothetical protein